MNKLEYLCINATAIGFFPEVIIAGLLVYFGIRFFLERSKIEAIISVFIINLLGQMYYDMPKLDTLFKDIIGTIFFTLVQTFGAIANYSFLEAIKIIDLLKRFTKNKAEQLGINSDPK